MDTKESLGFLAMASFESKLTLVEGVLLGTGTAIALTAAHMASRSLAEVRKRPPMPFTSAFPKPGNRSVEQVIDALEKDMGIATIFIKHDQDSGPNTRLSKQGRRIRLEKYAKVIAATDLDERGLDALLSAGLGDLVREAGEDNKPDDMRALAMVAKRPAKQIEWMRVAAHRLNPYARRSEAVYEFFRDFDEISPEEFDDARKIYETVFATSIAGSGGEPVVSAVRLLRGGFSSEEVRKLGRAASSMNVRWDDPEIGQAAKEILKKYSAEEINSIGRYLRSNRDVLNFLDLGLESIPDEKYEIFPMKQYKEGALEPAEYQWGRYAKDVRDFQAAPKALFEKANVPPDDYLEYWRAFQKNDDVKSAVYTLAAAGEAVPSKSAKEMFRYLAKRVGSSFSDDDALAYNLVKMEKLAKALKSGLLQKLDKTVIEQSLKSGGQGDEYLTSSYEDKFLDLIDHIDKIKDWKSYGDLSEQLAVATGQYSSERSSKDLSEEQKILRRSRDRLAQRDPEWAISEFPAEYKRGRRIAKFLDEITDHVIGLVDAGETVVIHGRDGELLYDLLKRRLGSRDMSRVRYALTSRPMTTMARVIPEAYKDYLGRMVPKNAIHIDTGFAGSIPRWFDAQGYQVKGIQMVSATKPEEQIPVSMPISNDERREIVLSDLEHSSQRLENPTQYVPATADKPESGGFRGLVYSWAAPGFHARAYGVYDELGIPRLTQKTPKTRYEEQQKFRIAIEKPEVIEEDEETVVKKALK